MRLKVENVSLCVGALRALGADVGAVNPGELAAGSTLWPVLALLFALSRYKQRAKQLQDMPNLNQAWLNTKHEGKLKKPVSFLYNPTSVKWRFMNLWIAVADI
ncbi:protein sickie-like protein [Lasius niger]|uniref:Protein sickie-like protein n=1 Tax=Lasius niger TaxID=67767 RepID=A0A0J7KWS8_LASNI|nr:protein sickie-like protein [Lasius niger]